MAVGGTFLNFDSLNPIKIWENLSLDVREAVIKTGFRAGGNLVATEIIPRLFPKWLQILCPGSPVNKGLLYAGSTLFGFGANTFLRSIGEYVSAENNTSQSDFSLSLEGRGIQGEGEIPEEKKSYWNCVERAATESFQTSLFTLTGMGSALGLKAFLGKNKTFVEKATGLLGNKAPHIFQEVGMNLSTALLQLGSQVFSGQPVTSSTLMNTGLMMLSGLGGTARESGLGNSVFSIAREAVHRVGETWVQSKIEGKEMNWVQAIGSLEGVTQRMMGGTLHLAGLSHRPQDVHSVRRFGESEGGKDLDHTVFTSMGASRKRQGWSDIPYENLSEAVWVEKIGEHLLKNGLIEKSKVRVGVDLMMKPEGIQPCLIHIPPKTTLATFHSQVTLEFEVREKEIVTAIAAIDYGGKGDLPRLRSGLLGNPLLGKSTKENYPQIWHDCVEGRIDFLFHGQVAQGLGLGLTRKKANWVNQDYTTKQFEAYWADKSVHQLFENEPWVSNLNPGECVEMVLTGLATEKTLRPQGCCVIGTSSLIPQSPTIYKVKIKLTRTQEGYEIESVKEDCVGNNASSVASMMGLDRSPVMSCVDLFRLEKNEIPLDDWYEIIGNNGKGKERVCQLRERLAGDERFGEGLILSGYVENGLAKNPVCRPLNSGFSGGKGITSIRFEFQGENIVIAGIDGVPKLLKHHRLIMGSHLFAPHFIPEAFDDAMIVEWRGVDALSLRGFAPLSKTELVSLLHNDSLDWTWEKVRTQRRVPPFKAFLIIADENSSYRIKIVRADVSPVKPDSWVIPVEFGRDEAILGEIPPVFSVSPHQKIPKVIRVRPNAKSQLGLVLKTPTMAGLEALCSPHGKSFVTQWYKATFGKIPNEGGVVSIYGQSHNDKNWREDKIPGGFLGLEKGQRDFPKDTSVPLFHLEFKEGEWVMLPGKSWGGTAVRRYVDLFLNQGCIRPNAIYHDTPLRARSPSTPASEQRKRNRLRQRTGESRDVSTPARGQRTQPQAQPILPSVKQPVTSIEPRSLAAPIIERPKPSEPTQITGPVLGTFILPKRHTEWAMKFTGESAIIQRMGALEAKSSGLTSPLARHLMHVDLEAAYGGKFGISTNLARRLEEKAEVYAYYDQRRSEGTGVADDVFTRALGVALERKNHGAQGSLLEMVHEYLDRLKQ